MGVGEPRDVDGLGVRDPVARFDGAVHKRSLVGHGPVSSAHRVTGAWSESRATVLGSPSEPWSLVAVMSVFYFGSHCTTPDFVCLRPHATMWRFRSKHFLMQRSSTFDQGLRTGQVLPGTQAVESG